MTRKRKGPILAFSYPSIFRYHFKDQWNRFNLWQEFSIDIISALLGVRVVQPDPAWRAGGTTLQGYSTQQFMTAEPIKVDPTRKVELVLRLVAR